MVIKGSKEIIHKFFLFQLEYVQWIKVCNAIYTF